MVSLSHGAVCTGKDIDAAFKTCIVLEMTARIYYMARCIGKPEPLKDNLAGLWSRRIDEKNRIVYYEQDNIIYIVSCKGHYDN